MGTADREDRSLMDCTARVSFSFSYGYHDQNVSWLHLMRPFLELDRKRLLVLSVCGICSETTISRLLQ